MTREELTEANVGLVAGLMMAVGPALVLAACLIRPIWDVDIFWQLKLGELTLLNRGLVTGEPFAATHLGEPLPAFAWLGQVLFALVREWTGWAGLKFANAYLWAAGFWLAYATAIRRGARWETAAAALILGWFVAGVFASIRPQNFALFCFGLMLWLPGNVSSVRYRVPLMAGLFLFWQNAHPSVAIAVAWYGTAALRDGYIWARARRRYEQTPIVWEHGLLALLAAIAIFITPDGWGYLPTAAANARLSQMMSVDEWLPAWAEINWRMGIPMVLISAGSLFLMWRSPRRIDGILTLPWLVLTVMTIFSARFAIFWALALVPVLAPLLPPIKARRIDGRLPWLLAICVGPVLALFLPVRYHDRIPVAQLERLRATGVVGTIFVHFPWGGPAIDVGFPQWRVALDGRYYRYTAAEWQRYNALVDGRAGLADVQRAYRPAAYVLSPVWTPRLVRELRADPAHWRVLSEDAVAITFIPASRSGPVGTGRSAAR